MMTMVKRIFSGLMILLFGIFTMFIWGCGKDTPTEPTTDAQGKISTPDGTEQKTPGIGRVGETLSNGYYKVTLKEVSYGYVGETSYGYVVAEVENIGNQKMTYVGAFNFSLVTIDSEVYEIGASPGTKLGIGQKKEFEFDSPSEIFTEGIKLVFQTYEDVLVAGEKHGEQNLLPKGKTIGTPIVFDPNLFVPKVLIVWPEPENDILSTETIKITFSSPVDEKSINGISMTGGKVTAFMPRFPDGSISDKRAVIVILQGIAPGGQTLDVSMVTDQAGERLSGTTTFNFFVRPDKVSPTIIESKPIKGQTNLKPELCKSISITFSEPMNTGVTKAIIDPPINGQSQLSIDWQIEVDWYDSSQLDFSQPDHLATIQLKQLLVSSTKYTLTIQGEDWAGNKIEDKIIFETYTPDLTPPEIASDRCSPKNGATGIDPLSVQKIVIVFTESMNEVKVESLEPKDAGGMWGMTVDFSRGNDRLTLSFLGGGSLGNEMRVIITLSGKDMAGNPLKTTQYSFCTMRKEG